jgi:hypothetical protein
MLMIFSQSESKEESNIASVAREENILFEAERDREEKENESLDIWHSF